tara:strand:+ start:3894 stop:4130 length:237 start_codon:yes stop_codon:yes gene_type:complete
MKEYSIKVNLSEEDIYDLQRGREFNWNFPTEEDDNVIIKINLFQGEDIDEEEPSIEDILKDRDDAMNRFTDKLNKKEK